MIHSFLVDFLLMTSSGLQKLKHALDCLVPVFDTGKKVTASTVLTNERNQLKEVRGQREEV